MTLLEFNKFILSNLIVWIQSYEFSRRYATFFLLGGSIIHHKYSDAKTIRIEL